MAAVIVAAMKILHVIPSLALETGGPPRACLGMAGAIVARGHQATVFSTDHGMPPEVLEAPQTVDGIVVRYFPLQRPRKFATSWPMAAALMRETGAYDVVHLHTLHRFQDWAVLRACRRHGVPYVLMANGALDPYIFRRKRCQKYLAELLYQDRVRKNAAAIQYLTENERTASTPQAMGAPGVILPVGIDPRKYAELPQKGGFRARHPECGERPIVLFLGRLHEKKGLDILVRAFAACRARGLDAELVIAGPDEGVGAATERLAAEAGLGERVLFTGMISEAEKMMLLADANVFALTSHSENFGLTLIEAMACGLPILVSDHVDLWQEVAAARSGRVTTVDVAAVTEALEALLRDPVERRAMGERGKRLVAERFVWPRIGEALERLYIEVAAKRPVA